MNKGIHIYVCVYIYLRTGALRMHRDSSTELCSNISKCLRVVRLVSV